MNVNGQRVIMLTKEQVQSDPTTLYKKAVKKWGRNLQLSMLIEECAELIAVVNRLKRGRTDLVPLLEEIADVEIMLGQMRCIFDPELIDTVKQRKLKRLAEKLRSEDKLKYNSTEWKIVNMIAEMLNVEKEKVVPSASFVDDLGADSLDLVEMTMALEEFLDCDVTDADAERIRTVQDCFDYCKEEVG